MADEPAHPIKRGPWTVRATRVVYDNPWITVREHDVTRPDGAPGLYGVVSPKNLAIGVLPIFANGDVMLVGQHRFPTDAWSWELPEGGGPAHEDPLETARRELAEETGLTASHWREFLRFDVSNCVTDERAIAFLAWDLEQGEARPDGDEAITTARAPFHEALERAMTGDIADGFTLAMLAKADYMARTGALAPGLSDAIAASR